MTIPFVVSPQLAIINPSQAAQAITGLGIQTQPQPLTLTAGNVSTTAEIGLAKLLITPIAVGGVGTIYPLAEAAVKIVNTSGQTITGAVLYLTDEDAGGTHVAPIQVAASNFPGGGIATGSQAGVTFPVLAGFRSYAVLVLTFAVAPTMGSVTVTANLSPNGGAGTQLMGSIIPTHTSVSIGTSSTSVIAANANRKYILLVNDSDTTIYISLNGAAANGQGIRLNANGGSYELGPDRIVKIAITAINSVGTKNLLVTEGV